MKLLVFETDKDARSYVVEHANFLDGNTGIGSLERGVSNINIPNKNDYFKLVIIINNGYYNNNYFKYGEDLGNFVEILKENGLIKSNTVFV